MRLAGFVLPRAKGDPEEALLVVYFFGGQGGSADANLQRWMTQMKQPDGRPSREVARTSTLVNNDLKITLLDLTGTYVAEMTAGSAERYDKPHFRMKAAVVETPGGPYFVKVTGPEKTVARWNDSFTAFLKSLRVQ